MRLLRVMSLKWRMKSRYWRLRALKAEAQLEAEVWRNRAREDELITIPMRALGMFGMSARTGPAAIRHEPPALLKSADPWQSLTMLEQLEYESAYLPDALANRVSPHDAKRDFLAEIARRKIPGEFPM